MGGWLLTDIVLCPACGRGGGTLTVKAVDYIAGSLELAPAFEVGKLVTFTAARSRRVRLRDALLAFWMAWRRS